MKYRDSNSASPPSFQLLFDEPTAALILSESHQTRINRRREDEARLNRGEPIQGPAWIRDGARRIKYRGSDLKAYVASLDSVVDVETRARSSQHD